VHDLKAEVEENFKDFATRSTAELQASQTALAARASAYQRDYERLVSLQAWRTHIMEPRAATGLPFFLEAQNDGLVAHIMARQGAWRTSLMSLRSAIENVCNALYYMDHPVEATLWGLGKHRLGYADLTEYLKRHPAFLGVSEAGHYVGEMSAEYSELSKAVHASAANFRMTAAGQMPRLWSSAASDVDAWMERSTRTLLSINLVLLVTFREHLQGAAHRNLRKAISLAIPPNRQAKIHENLGVKLFK